MNTDRQDPLLAELRGTTTIVAIDPVAPVVVVDPLETKGIPKGKIKDGAGAVVAKSDAKHSVRSGGKGYAVKVQGEYFAFSQEFPGKKVKRPYKIVVNLPVLERAISIIKHHVLDPMLRAKYSDYVSFRTYFIVEATPLNRDTPEPTSLQYMARPALEAHICANAIPIVAGTYVDAVGLREAVIDFTMNPNGFAEREAIRQATILECAEIASMNPGVALVGEPGR